MAGDSRDPTPAQNSDECRAPHPEFVKELMEEFAALGDSTGAAYRAALQESTDEIAGMLVSRGDPQSAELLRETMALQDRARQSQYCLARTDLERVLALLQCPADPIVLVKLQTIITRVIHSGTLSEADREAVRVTTLATLDHPHWLTRVCGCGLARELDDSRLAPHVLPLLYDSQPEVRAHARSLLERWGYTPQAGK